MAILFEILLLIGFAGASFYIGYRYSIDFQPKVDTPYNPIDDIESSKGRTITKSQYQARQKELDKVLQQIEEAKQKEKKKLVEIDLLRAKSKDKVLSDQDFNNLLDE
ncbi:unnamed protein product [Paramecium sonneborni]|uniref:Uncharacterized protein n=1 Tax=Paramecium sonneborni TaxID=65129 RepID=A0A8S1PW53_9CILI|nr:unnamed protein product [Paramecium sonneborni]